jgi:23S rRNA pseudouridine1911/1915/1917 synthase
MDVDRAPTGSGVDRDCLGLPVLLDTPHELVLAKPSGMATELTSDPKCTSLLSRVRSAMPSGRTPRLPHRLDRVTRGIVVVALTDEAIRFHNAQIREGGWTKLYLARVRYPREKSLDDLVGLHRFHLRRRAGRAEVVRSGGKRAITEVIAVAGATDRDDEVHALLRLHTGRYHQIRVSMAALGTPLVDDWLYDPDAVRHGDRFYLEHIALRFMPFGAGGRRTIHRRDDPDRDPIDPALRTALDERLEAWEAEDAEER